MTDSKQGKHDDVTQHIIRVFYDVYNELGHGFLESVYQEAMRLALFQAGLRVNTQMAIPIHFRGTVIGIFKADLVVNESVLIELKACESLIKEHHAQTMNYLKATQLEVALLMNFGPEAKFRRLIMDNSKKPLKSVQSVQIGVKPSPGAAQ